MDIVNWWKGMENAMDAASLRQQVIANNIANAGNPNFQGQAVAFEDEMQKVMAQGKGGGEVEVRAVSLEEGGDPGNLNIGKNDLGWRGVRAKVVTTGQSVDVHQQMANLAKNQIQYNMLVDKCGGMMKGLIGIIDQLERR